MTEMTRRNAPIAKIVAAAVFVLGIVYFLYIFNETSGKLKDTERVANRYRREQEALSSQLADLRSEKENLQNRCDNERHEYQNRLSSANQQYKMLQSQNEDLQSEFTRLREDFNKDKEDHKLHDAQQNQEYMQLKQEKDLEIASLKDQVANTKREQETLNGELTKLKTQLQESQKKWKLEHTERLSLERQVGKLKKQVNSYEMSMNSLQEQNRALEGLKFKNQTQIGSLKQNIQQQQANLQQQNLQLNQAQLGAGHQNPVVQGNQVDKAANQMAVNMQPAVNNIVGQVGAVKQDQNVVKDNQINVQQQEQDKKMAQEEKNKLIEEHQQQHQVMPPNPDADKDEKHERILQLKLGKTSLVTEKADSKLPNIQPPNNSKGGNSKEKPVVPKVDDGQRQMPPPGNLVKDKEKDSRKDYVGKKSGDLHPNEVNQQQNIPPPNIGKSVEKNNKNKLKSVLIKGKLQENELQVQQNIPPPKVAVAMETPKQPLVGGDFQQQNIPPPKRGQRVVDDSVRFGEPLKLDLFKDDDEDDDAAKQPALPEM